jgi:hypothetical protein
MTRRFLPTVDIWTLSPEQRAALIPGQWVSAGAPDADRNNCGRFYGVKQSGSVVVAWNGNARTERSGDWPGYQRALYNYAKGR